MVGLRVVPDTRVRIGDNVTAEGVALGEAAQLRQELVAVDVVVPGARHGHLEGGCLFLRAGGSNALDAAELGEGVDAVRLERLDELADRLLWGRSNV